MPTRFFANAQNDRKKTLGLPAKKLTKNAIWLQICNSSNAKTQKPTFLVNLQLQLKPIMKNLFLILVAFILLPATTIAQSSSYGSKNKPTVPANRNYNSDAPIKLQKVTIAKRVTVSLPEEFTVMPDEGIAVKYPAARKPLGVYSSKNGQVDFSVNEKPTTFIAKDLPLVRDIYKASIMRTFSEVQFIREEIKEIDKKQMIVFEFVSTLKDENPNSNKAPVKKYTIIQYYIKGGKVMIFTFNAPTLLKDKWQETANKVMNSIKVS